MQITLKDEIEQFKRDLRSYTYHQKKVLEIEEKLEDLAVKMQGLSSPAFKEIVYENASDPYKDRKIELMCEEEKLVKERNAHLLEIKRLDDALDLLEKEKKKMIINIYIRRIRIDKVAFDYNCSVRKIKYDIDRAVSEMLAIMKK